MCVWMLAKKTEEEEEKNPRISLCRCRKRQINITRLRKNYQQEITNRLYWSSCSHDRWFYDRLDSSSLHIPHHECVWCWHTMKAYFSPQQQNKDLKNQFLDHIGSNHQNFLSNIKKPTSFYFSEKIYILSLHRLVFFMTVDCRHSLSFGSIILFDILSPSIVNNSQFTPSGDEGWHARCEEIWELKIQIYLRVWIAQVGESHWDANLITS